MSESLQDLRYPIGRYSFPESVSPEQRGQWIAEIAACPQQMRAAVKGLSPEQLATPYRPEGWTVQQVVHHVPDSHMNSFIRFKWTLTEDHPTIKTYHEAAWAELGDCAAPAEVSLDLLETLHRRWVILLKSLTEEQWKRTFHHPENGRTIRLDQLAGLYAWHGKHHVAHVTSLRKRMGW